MYAHGGLEEPNCAGSKTLFRKSRTWNVTGNRVFKKKLAAEKGMLFNLLLLYVLQIIHKIHDRIIHWEKFTTIVAQLNSTRNWILRMHISWYHLELFVPLTQ